MGAPGVIGKRADWVGLIEAAHGAARDDFAWAQTIVEALRPNLPRAAELGMYVLERDSELTPRTLVNASGERHFGELVDPSQFFRQLKTEVFDALHYTHPTAPVSTAREVIRTLPAEFRPDAERAMATFGIDDALGIVLHPTADRVIVFHAIHDGPIALSPYDRRLLTRVAWHIDSAYRLRQRPDAVEGELFAEGRLLVARVERDANAARLVAVHSGLTRTTAGALDLWPALVAGRFSLVPRSGSVGYAIVENPPEVRPSRALSPAEAEALAFAAQGLSTKLVAHTLGASGSAVSERLAGAAAKLGVRSRAELVRVAATFDVARAEASSPPLTAAEREVLSLVQRGLSNRQIAQLRSRSVRTIANQVAALLRKTGSPSRRALIVRGAPT